MSDAGSSDYVKHDDVSVSTTTSASVEASTHWLDEEESYPTPAPQQTEPSVKLEASKLKDALGRCLEEFGKMVTTIKTHLDSAVALTETARPPKIEPPPQTLIAKVSAPSSPYFSAFGGNTFKPHVEWPNWLSYSGHTTTAPSYASGGWQNIYSYSRGLWGPAAPAYTSPFKYF